MTTGTENQKESKIELPGVVSAKGLMRPAEQLEKPISVEKDSLSWTYLAGVLHNSVCPLIGCYVMYVHMLGILQEMFFHRLFESRLNLFFLVHPVAPRGVT